MSGTMLAKSKADLRFARPSYRQHTCAPGIVNERANHAGVTGGRKSVTVNATHCCKFSRVACARAPYFMRRPVFLLVVYTGAPVCRESGNMAYLRGRIMSHTNTNVDRALTVSILKSTTSHTTPPCTRGKRRFAGYGSSSYGSSSSSFQD